MDGVVMVVGTVSLENKIVGENTKEEDIVIGIERNGIKSNGQPLARRIFFEKNDYAIDATFPELGHTLGLTHNRARASLMCGPCSSAAAEDNPQEWLPLTASDRARLRALHAAQ